jgi:enoyl-CoA hydratase/carnithine racemase
MTSDLRKQERTSAPVVVEDRGPVRWLWLNRPEARNAQNAGLLTALEQAVIETASAASIRVVVLAGVGSSFSAGHDLREVVANRTYRENISTAEGRLWQELDLFVRPVEAFRSLRVPTICRVQGYCLAASMMLLDAADLVVAADDAIFASPVTRTMAAADVELPVLGWALGSRIAKQLMWTDSALDAAAAARLGLVNWVVSAAELDEKVNAVADELLQVAPEALALTKMSLRFMEDAMGRQASFAHHFALHQLSHQTTPAERLLEQRIVALEEKLGQAASDGPLTGSSSTGA